VVEVNALIQTSEIILDPVIFADDKSLHGDTSGILAMKGAKTLAHNLKKRLGLSLNNQKSFFVAHHDEPLHQSVVDFAEVNGYRIIRRQEAFKSLGTPIGHNKDSVMRLANERLEKHRTLFENLQHPNVPVPISQDINRQIRIPNLNHLQRTTIPGTLTPIFETFDSDTKILLSRNVGLDIKDSECQQSALPFRFAGLNLQKAGQGSERAFIAAVATAAVQISARFKDLPEYFSNAVLSAVQSIRTYLPEEAQTSLLPPESATIKEFLDFYTYKVDPRKMQKRLSRAMDKQKFDHLLSSLPKRKKALMNSCRAKWRPAALTFINGSAKQDIPKDFELRLRSLPENEVGPPSDRRIHPDTLVMRS
jgi:hypothetical protein